MVDPNTVERVVRVASVAPGDKVVEVGPGLGSLTLALASAGASVVAVELDRRLADLLPRTVEGLDVRVVAADAMTLQWPDLLGVDDEWAMVANLPYNVATPMVLRALEEAPMVQRLTVMVQREVGERWVAEPGDAAYGAVSVKLAWWCELKLAGSVPASVFMPAPKVESVLVTMTRREIPKAADRLAVFRLIEAGFATRRKMLRRNLAGLVDEAGFRAAGVEPTQRAEELGLDDWVRLAERSTR